MLRVVSACVVVGCLLLAAVGLLRSVVPGTASAQPAQAPPQPGGMPPPPGAPQGPGGPRPSFMAPAATDSFAGDRDSLMNEVLKNITGRENMPAESVFKNIKSMKGFPAGRLLRAMNMGFGRSLGVGCNYCHVVGHWADDDKPKKEIARGMMEMVGAINNDLLPKIKNLGEGGEDKPVVNCNMCHRGSRKPGRGFDRGPGQRPGGPGPTGH